MLVMVESPATLCMTTTFMPAVQPAPKRKPEALVVSSS